MVMFTDSGTLLMGLLDFYWLRAGLRGPVVDTMYHALNNSIVAVEHHLILSDSG